MGYSESYKGQKPAMVETKPQYYFMAYAKTRIYRPASNTPKTGKWQSQVVYQKAETCVWVAWGAH